VCVCVCVCACVFVVRVVCVGRSYLLTYLLAVSVVVSSWLCRSTHPILAMALHGHSSTAGESGGNRTHTNLWSCFYRLQHGSRHQCSMSCMSLVCMCSMCCVCCVFFGVLALGTWHSGTATHSLTLGTWHSGTAKHSSPRLVHAASLYTP
jgi:hypothetical protein